MPAARSIALIDALVVEPSKLLCVPPEVADQITQVIPTSKLVTSPEAKRVITVVEASAGSAETWPIAPLPL